MTRRRRVPRDAPYLADCPQLSSRLAALATGNKPLTAAQRHEISEAIARCKKAIRAAREAYEDEKFYKNISHET